MPPRRVLWSLFALLALGAGACRPVPAADDLGPVADFSLTESGGRTVSLADLKGKVWVASFQFTRCTAGCPEVSQTMQRLQRELAGRSDVRLVTFTVDPKHDNLEKLRAYAVSYKADPERWLFLTGPEKEIDALMTKGFRLSAPQRKGETAIDHEFRLVLVGADGHVLGYFDGKPGSVPDQIADEAEKARTREFLDADYEKGIRKLLRAIDVARLPAFMPRDVPLFNATLNAFAGLLLLLGYAAIRQRAIFLHKACMLTAVVVSAAFLASYLYFHLAIKGGQATKFTEQAAGAPEWAYYLYFAVLGTHTVMAMVVAPLALWTSYLGLRNRLAGHVRLARWTLPIWLYVSATGVVVYAMLYRAFAVD